MNQPRPLDRSVAPACLLPPLPSEPELEESRLCNGARFVVMRLGTLPIVKVDVVLRGGMLRSPKAGVARAAADLITQGCEGLDHRAIAERLDERGACVYSLVSHRHCTISLLALQRQLSALVPLFSKLVLEPTYPDDQVDLYRRQQLEMLATNELKSGYVAMRRMLGLVYAAGNAFGRRANRADYEMLSAEDIREFQRSACSATDALVFVSGQPSAEDVARLRSAFEALPAGQPWTPPKAEFGQPGMRLNVELNSQQTTLCLCRQIMGEADVDFIPYRFLDVALGGHFGSRLMGRLREKMGLTYNVGSFISSNRLFGLHYISSNLRAGSHVAALSAVQEELGRLRELPLTEAEMTGARGAMVSDGLKRFDTLLAASTTICALLAEGYDYHRLEEYHRYIREATAADVQRLARQWLDPGLFHTVVVGKGVEG